MKTIMSNLGAGSAGRRLVACLQTLGLCLLCFSATTQASSVVQLALGGTPESVAYSRLLLEQTLASEGCSVVVHERGNLPMTRLELMLQRGDISVLILGPTAERDRKFLPVRVDMTDNLVNQRILFIPKGSQALYDPVHSLEDFRRLQRVAGVGVAWAGRPMACR